MGSIQWLTMNQILSQTLLYEPRIPWDRTGTKLGKNPLWKGNFRSHLNIKLSLKQHVRSFGTSSFDTSSSGKTTVKSSYELGIWRSWARLICMIDTDPFLVLELDLEHFGKMTFSALRNVQVWPLADSISIPSLVLSSCLVLCCSKTPVDTRKQGKLIRIK